MPTVKILKKQYGSQLTNLDFDILLSHAIQKPKEFLYTHPDFHLSPLNSIRLAYFLFQYKRGYSVAAITHHKEFCGLNFYVNKHTLIPRPATEVMVEETVREILNTKYQILNTLLIDVGTGSGCIPIAINATLQQHNTSTPKTFAIDISHPALRVAKKNAQMHNVSINFLHGNLLEPIINNPSFFIRHSSFVITANLPYLTPEQFAGEPSIQKEPHSALVAESDGLALYEQLLQQIQSLFNIYHLTFIIFLEIDPSQTEKIRALVKRHLPEASVEIKKDMANQDRIVKILIHTLN